MGKSIEKPIKDLAEDKNENDFELKTKLKDVSYEYDPAREADGLAATENLAQQI